MEPTLWKKHVFDVVRQISDPDYQRRSWFGIGPEQSSPTEMFCMLFDDLLFEEFTKNNPAELSPAQIRAACVLIAAMDEFDGSSTSELSPSKVFDDHRWQRVRQAAQALLNA